MLNHLFSALVHVSLDDDGQIVHQHRNLSRLESVQGWLLIAGHLSFIACPRLLFLTSQLLQWQFIGNWFSVDEIGDPIHTGPNFRQVLFSCHQLLRLGLLPVVISPMNWGHPGPGDTDWLATVADKTILGGEKMTTAVASVAGFLCVGELMDPQNGELAEVCGAECALVGFFVRVSSNVNLQFSTGGRLKATDIAMMLRFCVLHFYMGLESRRSSKRSLTNCALKWFKSRVFVEVVL